MASATPLTTGIGRAIGCDYHRGRNHMIFVETDGRLSRVDLRARSYAILGTGYEQPEDVVIGGSGTHVYITERIGTLLRVSLETPDRAHAVEVTAGLNTPHLLAVDDARGHAYVVERTGPGRLLRIDLATGEKAALVRGLEDAIGLLMTHDLRYAYISEHAGRGDGHVIRIDLETGRRHELVTDPYDPGYLSWSEADGPRTTPASKGSRRVALQELAAPAGAERAA
jgi:hypothetical protein